MKNNIENAITQQTEQSFNPIRHINYNVGDESLNISLNIEGLLSKNYKAKIHQNKLFISALHCSSANNDETNTPKFDCIASTWSLFLPCSVDQGSISSTVQGDKLLISMLKA